MYGSKAKYLFSCSTAARPTSDRPTTIAPSPPGVRQYGVLQEVVKTGSTPTATDRQQAQPQYGARTAGASPALVRWLLDRSVFVGLEDLGFALPDYDERPQLVAMTPAMAERYSSLLGQLRKAAIAEALLRGDHSLLGGYLSALITWPDAPWRGKTVVHPPDWRSRGFGTAARHAAG